MNGETPSVPITTLAGVASMTDLLPELPLPTPQPQTMHNNSLLYNPAMREEAQHLLRSGDKQLAQQLSQALQQTSTDHVELKDSLAGSAIEGEVPNLLKAIFAINPHAFGGSGGMYDGSRPPGMNPPCSQNYVGQPQVPPQPLASFPQSPLYPNSSPRTPVSQPTRHPNQGSPYAQHGSPFQNSGHHFPTDFQPFSQNSFPQQMSPAAAINGDCYASENLHRSSRSMHGSMNHREANKMNVPPPQGMAGGLMPPMGASPMMPQVVPEEPRSQRRRSSSSRSGEGSSHSLGPPAMSHHRPPETEPPHPPTLRTSQPVVMLEPLDAMMRMSRQPSSKPSGSSRPNQPVVMLEPLDPAMLQSIAAGGSVRTGRESGRRRGGERNAYHISHSADDSGLTFSVSRNRGEDRGRRKRDYVESDEDSLMEVDDEEYYAAKRRKKEKRHRRPPIATLSVDELLESPVFKKFTQCADYILDGAEDINFMENDDEAECPPESLVPKGIMGDLCGETAKLKSMNVMNQIPPDRLVKLLTILHWNIRDGMKITPNIANPDDDAEEEQLWRELTMERVMRSMDAALTALYIMTSADMPKQVYLEDVIEKITSFGRFQLQNTIYPEFDPVYKIDPSKDGYHGSLKMKRARAHTVKHKSTIALYNKMCELIGCLGELLEIQELTDVVILQASTLGVSPFFVENISELQLNALKLVTTIFCRYDRHRHLITEEILASLARLPSTKRNLRNYRLNADESIQMVTALALQLIQCVVRLPDMKTPSRPSSPTREQPTDKKDKDVLVVTSYETAMRTGHNFLTVFLKKCTSKGEDDFRPLFENFVQDLLSTVNKPEWPASEVLLSLLGRILVKQFSSKQTDMSLRVASLEYLGIVAARLRKDAVTSQLNQEIIEDIVRKVNEGDNDEPSKKKSKSRESDDLDTAQSLQKALLEYLDENSGSDPALQFAKQFYIAQWFRDTTVEMEKTLRSQANTSGSDSEMVLEEELSPEIMQQAEQRKAFLLNQATTGNKPSTVRSAPSKLDYDSACLSARYLSSKRPFAQSFDVYLTQILKVLSETAVAVRTKAMKCLSAVVEADPGILARVDMQRGVHGRFLDQSTSVREAAVELVGKFILIRPELIPQYYDMLSDRILDTGVSVRKRVIKIFKDICIEQPDFPKIPDMCVKMIRRVNDEEGIKKLVNEVFQVMWFTPLSSREKDSSRLIQRVMNITDVVAASKDTGYEFFEQLLENLLKKDEDGNFNKSALQACRQIVDCLVENVLKLEERSVESGEGKGSSSRLVACLSTLYLFSKIKPDLMLNHATTLQPYLDIKCSTQGDMLVLHHVARILELVVPLMDHPSETFLMQLEEDMMKLILRHGMMVVQSCISCLGAVVNHVSHNYSLVRDCFQKFFGVLCKLMEEHKSSQGKEGAAAQAKSRKPTLLRSLFTVGLLCKHFDFDSKEMGEARVRVRDKVFDVLVYFISHEDEEVRHKALTAIGFMVTEHYDYLLGKVLKDMYCYYLTNTQASTKLRIQVLRNLQNYLIEEEVRMQRADQEWKKHCKEEDLKEMGDIQSGMASTIMQVYLKQVLESFVHANSQVRMAALGVITLVLKQGLVHPIQCMPYLICMGSDPESAIRVKADQQLQDIEKKYPGFTHMKALAGIKESYRLQQVLHQNTDEPIRGYRQAEEGNQSLNAFLFTVLRANRSHRRALLTSLLHLFDDSGRISLPEQLYIADNLAFFPYQTQDEPLFIIHHIDMIVSLSGSNLIQSFKEILAGRNPQQPEQSAEENGNRQTDDDDEDDTDAILRNLPDNIQPLQDIIRLSQGCVLLLILRQHLKEVYNFSDSKIQRYSPTENAKVYDKPLTRKQQSVQFNPLHTMEVLRQDKEPLEDEEARQKLVDDYLAFRELMIKIDPQDDDDSGDERPVPRSASTPGASRTPSGAPEGGEEGEGEKPMEVSGDERSRMSFDRNDESRDGLSSTMSFTPRSPRVPQEKKRRSHASHKTPQSRLLATSKSTPVSNPKKKRKRRKRFDVDDDDEEDSDDPDFMV